MKKMKKWELLKKAYETFPTGTKCTWGGGTIISTGAFEFSYDDSREGWIVDSDDMCVFDGEKWAEIIEEPKQEPKKQFIMISEDGVALNRDDNYCMVKNIPATGNVWKVCIESVPMNEISFAITDPDHCKAFSTKEAAEKWCEEQNKPKSITIGENSQYPVVVTATEATIKCMGDVHKDNIILWPGEINEIADALEQLNAK